MLIYLIALACVSAPVCFCPFSRPFLFGLYHYETRPKFVRIESGFCKTLASESGHWLGHVWDVAPCIVCIQRLCKMQVVYGYSCVFLWFVGGKQGCLILISTRLDPTPTLESFYNQRYM